MKKTIFKLANWLLYKCGYIMLYGNGVHQYLYIKAGDNKKHSIAVSFDVVYEDAKAIKMCVRNYKKTT